MVFAQSIYNPCIVLEYLIALSIKFTEAFDFLESFKELVVLEDLEAIKHKPRNNLLIIKVLCLLQILHISYRIRLLVIEFDILTIELII